MIVKGAKLDWLWIEGDKVVPDWAYHSGSFYHMHIGGRPTLVAGDNRCLKCDKEIPGLIALAFKLHNG
jgi:hypothetical protein